MRSLSCLSLAVRGLVWYTLFLAHPKRKNHRGEIRTSEGHSCGPRLPNQRRGKFSSNQERSAKCKVRRWPILHENYFVFALSTRYNRANIFFQHLKIAFTVHGAFWKIWSNDFFICHSTSDTAVLGPSPLWRADYQAAQQWELWRLTISPTWKIATPLHMMFCIIPGHCSSHSKIVSRILTCGHCLQA